LQQNRAAGGTRSGGWGGEEKGKKKLAGRESTQAPGNDIFSQATISGEKARTRPASTTNDLRSYLLWGAEVKSALAHEKRPQDGRMPYVARWGSRPSELVIIQRDASWPGAGGGPRGSLGGEKRSEKTNEEKNEMETMWPRTDRRAKYVGLLALKELGQDFEGRVGNHTVKLPGRKKLGKKNHFGGSPDHNKRAEDGSIGPAITERPVLGAAGRSGGWYAHATARVESTRRTFQPLGKRVRGLGRLIERRRGLHGRSEVGRNDNGGEVFKWEVHFREGK